MPRTSPAATAKLTSSSTGVAPPRRPAKETASSRTASKGERASAMVDERIGNGCRRMAIGEGRQVGRAPVGRVDDDDFLAQRLVDRPEMRLRAQNDDVEVLHPQAELHEGVLVDGSRRYRRHTHNDAIHRSEEHTSELQSLMRISYAVFCLKKKTHQVIHRLPKNSTNKCMS